MAWWTMPAGTWSMRRRGGIATPVFGMRGRGGMPARQPPRLCCTTRRKPPGPRLPGQGRRSRDNGSRMVPCPTRPRPLSCVTSSATRFARSRCRQDARSGGLRVLRGAVWPSRQRSPRGAVGRTGGGRMHRGQSAGAFAESGAACTRVLGAGSGPPGILTGAMLALTIASRPSLSASLAHT